MRSARKSVMLPNDLSRSAIDEGGAAAVLSGRRDPTSLRLFTALCMVAASPATIAVAQQAAEPADELPPLVVEAPQKKKKSTPAKKAAAPSPVPQPPPAVEPAAAPETPPLPGQAGPVPAGEYKADYSASNKFTGPLRDTPQTVTVVPGTIIQERGATNLTETLRNTPGITFDAGENGFSVSTANFKLRGFDTSGSIFHDGVRSNGSFARDMFNIEQVEVVKGAAADNGRGAAGGYINMVTKTPMEENFVRGEASIGFDEYDSEARFRSTVDVNQRIGTVAVRMNGMIEDGGVAGRDVAEAEAYGLAPSITLGMGTDFRATFAYERIQRNDLPDWGVPAHSVKGMFRYDPTAPAARASRDTFYGLASDFDDVEGDSVLARFEYDISPTFTLSNQTRWAQTDRFARFLFPNGINTFGGNPNVITNLQYYDRENTSISNMTNLAGTFVTGAFRHTISTGVEVTREESDALRRGQVSNYGDPTDIFDPDPNRQPPRPFDPVESNGIEIDTVAGYFYDTVQLTRQLQLTGGVRVEHYKVEIDSKTLATGLPTPDGIDGYEQSETTVGGKIGLVYKPIEDGTLYASYGVSALPPGSFLSNPDISRAGDGAFPGFVPDADPVEMHNYEVGVKWDFFGGKLSTTAAAFHTEKKNVPYVGVAPDPEIVYGEQVVQGIELGIAGNLTDKWRVFGGLLVLDSERKHGDAVDRAAKAAGANDYTTGGNSDPAWVAKNPAGVDTTDGDELSFTPEFSATLWMTYDVTDKLTFGGGVQYVGESWIGRPDDALRLIPNGKYGKLPDYFLVNVMAAYELTENVDLQFNVDNVFDEEYAISTNWPAQRVLLGGPRTYRVGTSFNF